MTRYKLAQTIAAKMDISVVDADKMVSAVFAGLRHGIVKDGDVILRGFGRFVVRDKKERMGRNPKTGKPAIISARKSVTFKASKLLKNQIQENSNF